MIIKDLGAVSAYAYAVEKGYTGTEEEFATLMASYATVAEEAAESAESASTSATSASASAQTATTKASEATTAAQTATAKAEEAQADADAAALDASQALSAASTATSKASEAAQSASDAVTAKTAAQTAQTAAEGSATTAQTAAQTATQKAAEAAESARTLTIDTTLSQSGQAADSKVVGDKISTLNDEITDFEDKILVDNNIIDISSETMMHTAGDGNVEFDGNNGFSYTAVTAGNNMLGFTIPTQAKITYTLTLDVSDVSGGSGVMIYVCPTRAYNTSNALAYEDYVTTDKTVTLEFTATTSESSLWFYIRYNTPSVNVTNIRVDDGIMRYKLPYIMDYDGGEISVFNKIACVGDSITEGTFNYTSGGNNDNVINISKYSYPTILQKLTGVETANLGRGGNTAGQWYTYYQNADLSGFDACIIMLGINDGVYTTPLADFTTAIKNIIDKFKTENTGIKVFLSTIIPAYTDYDGKFDAYNTEIKRIAEEEYSDIYLLDINKYSICKAYTPYAQGHLTAVGYRQLAKEFATLVSYIMHANLADFRNVQFIGTDKTYE